ncbi:MAG: DUF885 domain-containing protein [Pseudomonadota bacterium]
MLLKRKTGIVAATLCGLLTLAACSQREAEQAPERTEFAAGATGGNSDAQADSSDQSEAFRRFLEESYAVDMSRAPMTASKRGDRRNQDRWNSYAESFQDETRRINEQRLAQLAQFDRQALSAADQLALDIYSEVLQGDVTADEFRHHQFVIQQFRGPHTEVPSDLINFHPISNTIDADAYVARLYGVENLFNEVIEQLEIRNDKNLLLADWQYPQIIQAAQNVVTGFPFDASDEDSVIWADFSSKMAALDTDAQTRDKLLDSARVALVDAVGPAYSRLIEALQSQSENAPDADGVWKFDNGDAFYAERLAWFTTTDLTAQEIHELGLAEVARIHSEMISIKDAVGFEGSLQAFFAHLRDDDRFYYPDSEEGKAAYLADATALIEAMYDRLPEQFGILPEADLEVRRVEAFREKTAGKAFYQRPPGDGSMPGVYYANLHNMKNMPKYQMEALAYHEGVPGHHMQLAIAGELDDVHEFQKHARFIGYIEGWGLYSELLPKEMGFYQDPYSDFGRLAMSLWRAARLVVDTGLHDLRWTREQAIDYLVANTPNSRADSTRAIERYIAMPGQATAYTVGMLKILELRERAKASLGDNFDIRAFHDEILKDGAVPLSILEQKIEAMIAVDPAAEASPPAKS